ncbi:MAG: helix-turn-helix domain-containing protein [Gemmataceae bacterium]|nr:helix-turn-helix domain-containing protein [Gemmataceae bacterium]
MTDFATRLRRLREALGLSQSELAARCGLSIDSLQNWEQNRVRPRLSALIQLAQCLGVSLDALVADQPKKRRGRPKLK